MAERLERLKMLRVAAVAMRSKFGEARRTSGDFPAVRRVDTFHELLQPDRRGKQPEKSGA